MKIGLLGQIADRWLELGSIERARPILHEGQAILADWPKDNWFFGAEEFADHAGQHRSPGGNRDL